jgi:hypothetical protein
MKFILNDQIWRTQGRVLNGLRCWEIASLDMRIGILDFRGPEAVTRAKSAHLPEEHLSLTLPRHLCELVYRRDHQRGREPIDLFVNNENW